MPPYPHKSLYLFFSFLTAAIVLSSCRFFEREPDHEAYFKKAITHAYSMPNPAIYSKAIPYIDSVYNRVPHVSTADLVQKYYFKSVFYLYYLSDCDKAMFYADSMLTVIKPYYNDEKYNLSYANAYLCKGNILYKQKYYSSAYQWYYLGKTILHQQDSCAYNKYMSELNGNLALVAYGQGKYKQAIRLFHERMNKVTCENGYEALRRKQGTLDDIGLCYRNLNRPDEAIRYFDKAISLILSQQHLYPNQKDVLQMALGLIYGNEGDAYLQKKRYALAEARYKASIGINGKKNFYVGDARMTQLKLAQLYVQTARFNEARLLLDSVKPALDTNYRPEMLKWLQTNAAYYSAAPDGDAKLAYNFLNSYVNLKDSVEVDMRVLAAANFNDDFDLLQQQYNLKQEVKSNRFNNILLFATFVLIVLLTALTGSILIRKGLLNPFTLPVVKEDEQQVESLNYQEEL
ncbi:tetratricopeptide repeat protein [Mucilaginibacter terrae]|uniref:tetratricopeptide repeat protein n=1 Tax=Mucilaginibacter terrae TaxID=1955052 RepID=UPI00363D85C0